MCLILGGSTTPALAPLLPPCHSVPTTSRCPPPLPPHQPTQVFGLLNLIIERLGPDIMPHAGAVLPLLPAVWRDAADQSLLRIQVLCCLSLLVNVLGADSPCAYPLLLPLLGEALHPDSSQPELLEDGLGEWGVLGLRACGWLAAVIWTHCQWGRCLLSPHCVPRPPGCRCPQQPPTQRTQACGWWLCATHRAARLEPPCWS